MEAWKSGAGTTERYGTIGECSTRNLQKHLANQWTSEPDDVNNVDDGLNKCELYLASGVRTGLGNTSGLTRITRRTVQRPDERFRGVRVHHTRNSWLSTQVAGGRVLPVQERSIYIKIKLTIAWEPATFQLVLAVIPRCTLSKPLLGRLCKVLY